MTAWRRSSSCHEEALTLLLQGFIQLLDGAVLRWVMVQFEAVGEDFFEQPTVYLSVSERLAGMHAPS